MTQQCWYAAHTKPNSERFAELALQEPSRGFTVYNPKILKRISHAGRVVLVERPFLPRYILVLADGRGSRGVRSAPGVAGVVCCGDRPAFVHDAEIDSIRQREYVVKDRDGKEHRYVNLDDEMPALSFRRHEVVRVCGGPFAGFNALFQCRDAAMRAKVFVDMMGRKLPVSLEYENIEKLHA